MPIQRKSVADVFMTVLVLTALGFIGLPRQAEAAPLATGAELQGGLAVTGDTNGMLIGIVVVLIVAFVSIVWFGIRRGRLA